MRRGRRGCSGESSFLGGGAFRKGLRKRERRVEMVANAVLSVRMSRVCEEWSLDELLEMDEEDMEALLGFYKPGTVPSFERIRLGKDFEEYAFDGSFGWW